jgi:DNA gyrase subunit A
MAKKQVKKAKKGKNEKPKKPIKAAAKGVKVAAKKPQRAIAKAAKPRAPKNIAKPLKEEKARPAARPVEEPVLRAADLPLAAEPAAKAEEKTESGIEKQVVNEKVMTAFGLVEPQPIVDEMRKSYLDYAMSVIVSRALPDVRDGLKPVHRRILYAMWSIGLRSGGKFRKSATVVGEVLGKYHPHGDSAVYDSMVRMAQDFSMRYPLVRGQGNFGSMDGDNAAAMRYTEAKLAAVAEELLYDIDKNTVDFSPNFDGSQQEPRVLPSKLPNLLMNGTMGIAVGMSTNIPPHNLRELSGAINHLIDNPDASVDDLMEYVHGPDFPTAGLIYNKEEIKQVYATGRGGIVMRGRAEISETKQGMFRIIISEIPYQVNKATLVEKIAELVKLKKLEGIKDLRDESDKDGVRVVVELKKDAYPKKILNALYKLTQLQETFHVNMLALIDGIQPRVLTLRLILEEYIKHREVVIRRRTQFDLDKARDRAHILEGLMIALHNIDAVIKVIKASKDREIAKENLTKKFKLTERQALAILEMRLAQLANLEQLKIENELKEKEALIKELEAILKSTARIRAIVKQELNELTEKFGDERRTKVIEHGVKDFSTEDLVPNEEAVVMMTRDGYIKRLPPDTFHAQGRGGKGVIGLTTKEEDTVDFMFTTQTHADILFFTTKGRAFQLKGYDIPPASRTAKGNAIVNFLQLSGEEKVTSVLPMEKVGDRKFLFFATEKGLVKKVEISAFASVRRSGLIAIKIKDDDKLIWAKPTSGKDEIQLITANGQAIRFKESDVRDMGRGAAGVHGMRLKKGDAVVGMGVISTDKEKQKKYQILSIMEFGYGKRTHLHLYKVQGRGGSGIRTAKVTAKTGKLINAYVMNSEVMEGKDLIVISEKGQVIRLPYKSVPQTGRDTQGVRLMRLKEASDRVSSVTWV